jgi:hypothetical protein
MHLLTLIDVGHRAFKKNVLLSGALFSVGGGRQIKIPGASSLARLAFYFVKAGYFYFPTEQKH